MALLSDVNNRVWRTDFRKGRSIYALTSNDINKTSELDPLIGVMETSELAENVVDTHNRALKKYGRRYLKALSTDD